MNMPNPDSPVILFDGVCNLCNVFVKTIIRADKNAVFKFLPLQSPLAEMMVAQTKINPKLIEQLNTVILIAGGKGYYKSKAVVEIARQLAFPWRLFAIGKFLPEKFVNLMYDFIANNRYRWFGRKDSCMVPTPEIMNRFIH